MSSHPQLEGPVATRSGRRHYWYFDGRLVAEVATVPELLERRPRASFTGEARLIPGWTMAVFDYAGIRYAASAVQGLHAGVSGVAAELLSSVLDILLEQLLLTASQGEEP